MAQGNGSHTMDAETLGAAYTLISELLAGPGADVPPLWGEHKGELRARLSGAPDELTRPIDAFLESASPSNVTSMCPLYLGAYLFGDPTACDGEDERNGYLFDILNVYWHFGLDPGGRQPPDYLPLMLEFAAISAKKKDVRDGPLARRHFLAQHLSPGLGPLGAVLEERAVPLAPLVRALEAVVAADLAQSAHLAEQPSPASPASPAERARKAGVRSLPIVEEP